MNGCDRLPKTRAWRQRQRVKRPRRRWQATAETLETTLDNMKVVEDMRRTRRDITELTTLRAN